MARKAYEKNWRVYWLTSCANIAAPTAERAATVRAMFTEAELARLTIVATDDLAPF